MNKFLITLLIFGFTIQIQAQTTQFGFTGGVNYNSAGDFSEIKTSGEDVLAGSEGKTGYHAGVYLQFGKDFYVRPEAVYTQIKSGYTWNSSNTAAITTSKIDVPVLVGKKIAGPLTIFGGPSFQYITNVSIDNIDYENLEFTDFTVGLQFGIGIQLDSFGIDARYERSLNTNEITFLDNNNIANPTYLSSNIDNRANQLIFSFSFKF